MKDLAEVSPLSREVMLQPLFSPLQRNIRFFRVPLPAALLAFLAVAYRDSGSNGLTVFRVMNQVG